MNSVLVQKMRREIGILVKEPWLLALSVWLPPLLFALFWWIFSAGSSFDLPIGVVDLDHSSLSRTLIRKCDASSIMSVDKQYATVLEGQRDLSGGSIYALMVIPNNLEVDTIKGRAPQATVFYNGQFILIGKQINGAMLSAVGLLSAEVGGLQAMAGGTAVPAVTGQIAPIRGQITPLFNINTNYAEFLASGGLPAIWQILIIAITVLSLAAEKRHGGLSLWAGSNPGQALIGKLAPYTLIMWLQGIIFLAGMYGWLGWPMNGSWTVLIFAQLLTVLACQAMGCLFFFLGMDEARGLSIAAAYAAPAFAFMGVTFPVTDMGLPALIWRALMPTTYYIKIQIHQANYGGNVSDLLPSFGALLLFALPMFLAFILLQKFSAESAEVQA